MKLDAGSQYFVSEAVPDARINRESMAYGNGSPFRKAPAAQKAAPRAYKRWTAR
jgi:hypothetical protein